MATTRIMPLHTGKGRSVGNAIRDILDYVENPDKTDRGRLITAHGCNGPIADAAVNRMSALLFELEMKGVIRALAGGVYRLIM